MLSVIRHVIHTLYFFMCLGVMAAGPLLPIDAGVHDLTVILAILKERMLGVIGFGQCYNHYKNCCLRETASNTCI